jgi:hypothetical protein
MTVYAVRHIANKLPRCHECGGYRKRVGFMPHEHDPTLRVDLYRCEACDARSAETVADATERCH